MPGLQLCLPLNPKPQLICDRAVAKTLNDQWVSFPVWTSEDAAFVASKKNPHEEALFRCEDERFELDLILECNIATIHVLEVAMDEMEQQSEEQRKAYRFNAKTLGGRSEVGRAMLRNACSACIAPSRAVWPRVRQV